MIPAFRDLLPCRVEQAVYGSFPFWDRGYGILARSDGCEPGWVAAFKTACQRYGERPTGTSDSEAFFARPLGAWRWMIVGVYPRGRDDLGRPGTTVFHALFVPRWHYDLSGASPFSYVPLLRGDYQATDIDRALPALERIGRPASVEASSEDGANAARIADALMKRRRVLVLSPQPIPSLVRTVWRRLPLRTRRRASVATWAYDTANHFHLAAMPRITAAAAREFGLIVENAVL